MSGEVPKVTVALRAFCAVVVCLLVTPAWAQTEGETTVILVRHAEKLLTGGDVDLSPSGRERAQALVGVVAHAGVGVTIASKYKRTRQTLEPTASALDLTLLEATEPQEVVREILTAHRGKTILVAGHSNTVPQIVERLGAPSLCPPFEVDERWGCMIPDPEYHHLFVVEVPTEGPATVIRASYGKPSG